MPSMQHAAAAEAMDCCDDTTAGICAIGSCATGGGVVMLFTPAGPPVHQPDVTLEQSAVWLRPYHGPISSIYRPPIA